MLSDHHYTRNELDQLCNAIQAGQPILYDPATLALNVRVLESLNADPNAFQCTACGKDVDSFDEALCPTCKQDKRADIARKRE